MSCVKYFLRKTGMKKLELRALDWNEKQLQDANSTYINIDVVHLVQLIVINGPTSPPPTTNHSCKSILWRCNLSTKVQAPADAGCGLSSCLYAPFQLLKVCPCFPRSVNLNFCCLFVCSQSLWFVSSINFILLFLVTMFLDSILAKEKCMVPSFCYYVLQVFVFSSLVLLAKPTTDIIVRF